MAPLCLFCPPLHQSRVRITCWSIVHMSVALFRRCLCSEMLAKQGRGILPSKNTAVVYISCPCVGYFQVYISIFPSRVFLPEGFHGRESSDLSLKVSYTSFAYLGVLRRPNVIYYISSRDAFLNSLKNTQHAPGHTFEHPTHEGFTDAAV